VTSPKHGYAIRGDDGDADRNDLRLRRLRGRRSCREYHLPGFPGPREMPEPAAAMNTSERVDIGGARAGS
jgi:hypothetical protein